MKQILDKAAEERRADAGPSWNRCADPTDLTANSGVTSHTSTACNTTALATYATNITTIATKHTVSE